jgi:hypothetical protein
MLALGLLYTVTGQRDAYILIAKPKGTISSTRCWRDGSKIHIRPTVDLTTCGSVKWFQLPMDRIQQSAVGKAIMEFGFPHTAGILIRRATIRFPLS